ncbi:MAG: UvrB/UvrC motif-containing protein [Candidatus Methylacidiphilales bacterium]
MQCTFCKGQEATCHLTKIVDGKVIEVHVCAKCIPEINQENLLDFDIWDAVAQLAQKKGMEDPSQMVESHHPEEISAKSFLLAEGSDATCPACGFSAEQLRKIGRLGCPECYGVFSEMLEDVIHDCQKGDVHTGKVPKQLVGVKIKHLEDALRHAIFEERFEEAAQIRDRIKSIAQT